MATAGIFELDVSAPYPCWIALRVNGEEVARFSHEHLADLRYAVSRAQQEAARRLGSDIEVRSPL